MSAIFVLGPLEVRDPAGGRITLLRRKQRALLAFLVVRSGEVVHSDEIIDALWGERPPPSARANLQNYVSEVRKTMAQATPTAGRRPRSHANGYVLELGADECDAFVFEALIGTGRQLLAEGRPDLAAERLTHAIGLWRGAVLKDLDDYEWLVPFKPRLERERSAAYEDLVEARLALGRHADLAVELAGATDRDPFRERLWGQYMRALHGAGRQADAIRAYERMRAILATELGVDPTSELQALYRRIRGSQTRPAPADRPTADRPVPQQLPIRMPMFTGRQRELDALTAALTPPDGVGGTAVIVGMGGAGKTWLAVRWAHEHRRRFPDGQLFVDLRGYHPSEPPVAAAAAVRGFLDALGVPPGSIPVDLHAQQEMFRNLVSGRRMLLVIDNARDTEQVAALLPESDTCAVIVTGRGRLTGLVSRLGAHAVPLDVVDDAAARQLIARRFVGCDVTLTAAEIEQIVAACGGLPLALGIAAARVAMLPRPLASTVVAELVEASSRLDAFDDDHPHGGLRAVLSRSLAALDDAEARAFLLLGLLRGPDIALPAVAALLGVPTDEAAATMRVLQQHSLVVHRVAGRWAMHDLVGLYASERAVRDLPEDERRAAISRLVDHYLHTARAVDRMLEPAREDVFVCPPAPSAAPLAFDDAATAWQWYQAEDACLTAVRRHAADLDRYAAVWQLAWFTDTFHRRQGRLRDRFASWEDALAAAEKADDVGAQALGHRFLGTVHKTLGQMAEAFDHLNLAVRKAEQVGDRLAYAHALRALSTAHGRAGRPDLAHELSVHALSVYVLTGERHLAHAMNGVGWYATFLGRHEEARHVLEAALEMAREDRDPATEANILDSLGYLFSQTGLHQRAVEHYRRALTLANSLGDAFIAAETEERLGDSYAKMRNDEEAHRHWQTALNMYRHQHRSDESRRILDRIGDTGV